MALVDFIEVSLFLSDAALTAAQRAQRALSPLPRVTEKTTAAPFAPLDIFLIARTRISRATLPDPSSVLAASPLERSCVNQTLSLLLLSARLSVFETTNTHGKAFGPEIVTILPSMAGRLAAAALVGRLGLACATAAPPPPLTAGATAGARRAMASSAPAADASARPLAWRVLASFGKGCALVYAITHHVGFPSLASFSGLRWGVLVRELRKKGTTKI